MASWLKFTVYAILAAAVAYHCVALYRWARRVRRAETPGDKNAARVFFVFLVVRSVLLLVVAWLIYVTVQPL